MLISVALDPDSKFLKVLILTPEGIGEGAFMIKYSEEERHSDQGEK